MAPQIELPYTVFRQLARENVPLSSSAEFGGGLAAACWRRDEVAETTYQSPNHHTLSLYMAGGRGIRRRTGGRELRSRGAGSLCLMPAGQSTDWLVAGAVDLFHLYIPRAVFERGAAATVRGDPAGIELPERAFLVDPWLEQAIRLTFLDKDWTEPADRLALSHAGEMILAHILRHYSTIPATSAVVRGGLAPAVRRRVQEYIEADLDQPLVLAELAAVAGLSPFHFARMFKQSTGETPHAHVERRRMQRARTLLAQQRLPIAEIAAVCGFSSQSHFTARFRKVTGMTPGRYRIAINRAP